MSESSEITILPYSLIVGQEQLKLALELSYIAPRIGGVLISGQRGTAKSTAARAFAGMMYKGELPVTLPINATEDRVMGGWDVDALMRKEPIWQEGLLEKADGKLLYIDEVNLLDDHIVNMILDVASTSVLTVEREGHSEQKHISFNLVGTMNPEEGGLRPQLLDRFGLMASVSTEVSDKRRREILERVLEFDKALRVLKDTGTSKFIDDGKALDEEVSLKLKAAQKSLYEVNVEGVAEDCVKLAREFNAEGHRGDYVTALAARACAARDGAKKVTREHILKVAPLALQHRRPEVLQNEQVMWGEAEDKLLQDVLGDG